MGPSAQNNDQVRRARGNAHVLIRGFSEKFAKVRDNSVKIRTFQGIFLYVFNALQRVLNTRDV